MWNKYTQATSFLLPNSTQSYEDEFFGTTYQLYLYKQNRPII